MFVGHGLLAFAVVGICARRFGLPARRALAVAVVAGLFATLPDVDVLYGPIGLLGGVSGVGDAVSTFWAAGNEVHRGPTHSLLVGTVAAGGFALLARRAAVTSVAGGGLLAGLVAVTAIASGALDAAVVAAFALVGVAVVALARRLELSAVAVLAAALVGLLGHPFGDLLTGSPPDLLYPLADAPIADRLALHGDATIHLLGAFALELAVIWLAVLVYFDLTDRSIRASIDRTAGLGAVYGAAAFVIPAPTVESASPFVLSVLSLGLVGASPTRSTLRPEAARAVATGLATVSLAAGAFAVAYLLT